jgi:hypothetical protein
MKPGRAQAARKRGRGICRDLTEFDFSTLFNTIAANCRKKSKLALNPLFMRVLLGC